MRKILAVLLLVCLAKTAAAQVLIAILFGDKLNSGKVEFGLIVSPCLTNITHIGAGYRTGLDLGLYFNIKLSEDLFFSPELTAKSAFGAGHIAPYPTGNDSLDNLLSGGSVTKKAQGFSMPLKMRYRIVQRLFAEAGLQADLLFKKSTDEFHATLDGNDLDYTKKIKDEFTRFDLGVTGGLIYKIRKDRGMGIGVRYLYGLTDVYKARAGTQVNSLWFLNVTIPIGASKANEAAAKQGK
jgi:hypothetical protein